MLYIKPLLQAGDLDKVKMLIKANADVKRRGAYGYTPLHWAANVSNNDIDIDDGLTPLNIAARVSYNHIEHI